MDFEVRTNKSHNVYFHTNILLLVFFTFNMVQNGIVIIDYNRHFIYT